MLMLFFMIIVVIIDVNFTVEVLCFTPNQSRSQWQKHLAKTAYHCQGPKQIRHQSKISSVMLFWNFKIVIKSSMTFDSEGGREIKFTSFQFSHHHHVSHGHGTGAMEAKGTQNRDDPGKGDENGTWKRKSGRLVKLNWRFGQRIDDHSAFNSLAPEISQEPPWPLTIVQTLRVAVETALRPAAIPSP